MITDLQLSFYKEFFFSYERGVGSNHHLTWSINGVADRSKILIM